MTYPTQHLNIFGVCPKSRFCAVRFYMMPLKLLRCSAIFAFASFFNNILDYFSNRVSSLARTPVPFMVVGPTHVFTSRPSHTRYRTIFVGASSPLAHLKWFFALFTYTLYKCFLFAWFYFLRACFRASIGSPSHMCMGAGKLSTARTTKEFNVPPTLNFSLEFGHG